MASTATYSRLRWGELTALTIGQIDQAGRVITVDRKVAEVAGHLYSEAGLRPRDWMAAQSPVPCITVAVSRDGFAALLIVTRRFTVAVICCRLHPGSRLLDPARATWRAGIIAE